MRDCQEDRGRDTGMRFFITSVGTDDTTNALKFYTEVPGLVKKPEYLPAADGD